MAIKPGMPRTNLGGLWQWRYIFEESRDWTSPCPAQWHSQRLLQTCIYRTSAWQVAPTTETKGRDWGVQFAGDTRYMAHHPNQVTAFMSQLWTFSKFSLKRVRSMYDSYYNTIQYNCLFRAPIAKTKSYSKALYIVQCTVTTILLSATVRLR